MTSQHTKSCGSHPNSTHYHQPCSCSLLEKEIEEAKVLRVDINDKDGIVITKSFLRQSLLRFACSVIEEAMPEEKKSYHGCITHRGLSGVGCDVCEKSISENNKNNTFNACRTQVKENVERILTEK